MKQPFWHYLVPPSILTLLTTAFYYPSLRYPFLFDDLPNILNNYEIKAQSTSAKTLLFSNPRWISKLINYFTFAHWQLNPRVYRIMDLMIHIFAGLLIFVFTLIICKRITIKRGFKRLLYNHALLVATITSGLFLLHPVQTQTATYITQIRLEGLVVLFSFATLICFALATYASKAWAKTLLYITCCVLVVVGAGSKEIIVVLPILLMLTDWFFLSEGDYKTFLIRLPIHLLITFLLYYTYLKLGSPVKPAEAFALKVTMPNNRGNILTQAPQQLITPGRYLIGQFRVILHYITMFFWPFGLSFDYGLKIPPSFWSPASILPFVTLMTILFTGLILFVRNTTNLIAFCIAWFFTVVLPRSTIIPSTEFVCDYKTYLASFAPLFLISIAITYLATALSWNTSKRAIKYILPSLLLVLCGYATMERNKVWSSRLAFWGDVIAKTEGHVPARAYNNYAVGLVNTGKPEKAAEYYKKAIKADNTYAEPVINLALYHQIKKEYKKAIGLYKHAMSLKEVHPEMYNNIGLLHLARKEYKSAEWAFKTAIRLRKHYSKAHFNLGQTYQRQNKPELARMSFNRALHGDTLNPSFHYNYGKSCYLAQQYPQAIKELEQVQNNHPFYRQVRFMLSNAYYSTRQFKKAIPHFAQIYKQNPSISTRYNYAQSLLQDKQYGKALPLFKMCRGSNKFPHTELHISKCLHYTGQTEQAKQGLLAFMKKTPVPVLRKMGIELMQEISQNKSRRV